MAPEWLVRELSIKPNSDAGGDEAEAEAVNEAAEPQHGSPDGIALAREALAALSASRAANHDIWIKVGLALHATSDSLLADWIQFSSLCPEKFREGECAEKWNRFSRNGKVQLGSLLQMAQDDGWVPPWKRRDGGKAKAELPPPWRPFPTDVLPASIAKFMREQAAAMGCDPAFVALPLLSVLASCVGNTRRIVLKRAWSEPSVIWAATIAPPSSLKSPAWQAAVDPLLQVQLMRMEEHELAMIEHAKLLAWHDSAMAQWKKDKTKSGDPPEKPAEPICMRHVTSDATVEALVALLADQPRGLLYAVDELAGWLNSLNCYKAGKGGDLQAFLSMHRAGPVTTDRKTGRRVSRVPRAALSICGTIQPKIYQRIASTEFRESGLLARILLAMPPVGRKRWTENDIDEQTQVELRRVIDGLLALSFDESSGRPEPIYLGMCRDAKDAWAAFYDDFAGEQADAEEYQAGCFGKIEAYCPRFALLLQMIRAVEGTASGDQIDRESMDAAITLARWFAHESSRVLAMLSQTDEDRERFRLIDLIRRKGGAITVRDLMNADRRYRHSSKVAEDALNDLVKAGFGAWDLTTSGPKGGRPGNVFRLKNDESWMQNPDIPRENEGSASVDNTGAPQTGPGTDDEAGDGEWEF